MMRDNSEYNKKYWKVNAKRIMEKRKKNGYYKKYYAENIADRRIRLNEWKKQWVRKNPERAKEINKQALAKWKLKPDYRYSAIKRNSKKKNRELLITKEDFIKWFTLSNKICEYCKITEQSAKIRNLGVLQVDRKDNSKGYFLDNITLACSLCNSIKSNLLTYEEMIFVGENIIQKRWSVL